MNQSATSGLGKDRRSSQNASHSQSGFLKQARRSDFQAAGHSTLSAGRLPTVKQALKQNLLGEDGVSTSQTALGRLPTLGLNQIKLEEFQDDDNNLFRVHKKTEHLLVARELEREFKDLNKFEKDNLRIWEKGISTRIDRPGTIRVINNIPAFKPDDGKKKGQVVNSDEMMNNQNKQKLNIFEAADSQMLKTETL